MAKVELKNLKKKYSNVEVIEDISLAIDQGSFTVLVGPSGCGKSTLLRMIAGLEPISGGKLLIDGILANDLDPTERGIAMVFQNYALYPHMSVEKNIAFSLKMANYPKGEIKKRVSNAADILQIGHLLDRKPANLSGGQRQRVAIGRAIVRDPKVFLFDEPLSNLDAELRVSMRSEIAHLHRRLKTTMIYVTHDQTEAMTMADQIVVLRDGKIEQVGTPRQLYEDPDNTFVAGFIGSPRMNFVQAANKGGVYTLAGGASFALPDNSAMPATVTVGLRPEAAHFDGRDGIRFSMEVGLVEYLGGTRYVHGRLLDGTDVLVEARETGDIQAGDKIKFVCEPEKLRLFDNAGQRLRTAVQRAKSLDGASI